LNINNFIDMIDKTEKINEAKKTVCSRVFLGGNNTWPKNTGLECPAFCSKKKECPAFTYSWSITM
jgi:hypothetical protein